MRTAEREESSIFKLVVEAASWRTPLDLKATFTYLKVLVTLIDIYERTLEVPKRKPIAPLEALEFLMEVNDLKQIEICRGTGIVQTHLSAFLAGTRNLSKTEIGKLSEYFKVSPLLFVDDKYFGGVSLSFQSSGR